VTISDKPVDVVSGGMIDHYDAEVLSAQDYYPFGMLQPDRKWSLGSYRYGFNGKENDNEVKGEGNQIDFGSRIHDPRVGRFLSVDP
jgi:RHS repeat-associated protein